jgi:hypothetical protein
MVMFPWRAVRDTYGNLDPVGRERIAIRMDTVVLTPTDSTMADRLSFLMAGDQTKLWLERLKFTNDFTRLTE